MRVLLVEDQLQLAESVAQALKSTGLTVDVLHDGVAADLALSSEEYAVAILDVGLPRMNGFEVLARLRARGKTLPVLMLTARSDVKDRVHGLNLGADDYLAKPFEMGELLARARGLVRRAAGRVSPVIEVGRLALDTRRMAATLDGAPIRLSPLEFRLLDCLAHNPGRAVSAGELAEQLYGVADTADTNAIEALVTRLRRKVGADVIETRRGFGYLLSGGVA